MSVYVDYNITRRVKEYLPELLEPAIEHGHTAIQELFTDKYADDADDYEYEVEVIARVHISKRSK